VLVALTVVDPVDANDALPDFPDWFFIHYKQEITDGVLSRMMSQPAKPYFSREGFMYHGRKFRNVRDKNSDKTPMIELTTENGGIVITDAINGQFELRITAVQNENFSLGNVVGDMFRMDIVPGPERLFGFRDRVRRPVTRNE
jgi:hypothetical protein